MNIIPTPLRLAPRDTLSNVTRLLFDVDDTVTWHGQMPRRAAAALYDAHEAGLTLVAVTGRSFAWAEMLMRLFPLSGCVAETGAVALWRTHQHMRVLHHEADEVRAQHDVARARITAMALARFPFARTAMDNGGRLYDTAFDLVEDGPAISAGDAAALRQFLDDNGMTTAQSSVHINAWLVGPAGPFNKATMVDRVLQTFEATTLAEAHDSLAYVGDSKNDGPMFASAGVSIGVANVAPHLDWLITQGLGPKYIVDGNGGHGFAAAVDLLLATRGGSAAVPPRNA